MMQEAPRSGIKPVFGGVYRMISKGRGEALVFHSKKPVEHSGVDMIMPNATLKAMVRDYPVLPFSTPAEQSLLILLQAASAEKKPQLNEGFTWEGLSRYSGLYPFLYPLLKRLQLEPPDPMPRELRAAFRSNSFQNLQRIHFIRQLVAGEQETGIPLLFVKGAAEICEFYTHSNYIGTRILGDIDFLCPDPEIERFHRYLIVQGHKFFNFGQPEETPSEVVLRDYALRIFAHGVYNHEQMNQIELHNRIAAGKNLDSYPPGFTEMLFKESHLVTLEGISVRVPSREHLVVYCICHAASLKDNHMAVLKGSPRWGGPDIKDESALFSLLEIIHERLTYHQLMYLFKLQLLLEAAGDTLDHDHVKSLLAQVPDQELLTDYLHLTTFALGHHPALPKVDDITLAQVQEQRLSYIEESLFPAEPKKSPFEELQLAVSRLKGFSP
jgi:hypothetical protein